MRSKPTIVKPMFVVLLLLAGPGGLSTGVHRSTSSVSAETTIASGTISERGESRVAKMFEAYGKLPLSFELNQGQYDSRVRFVSRSAGSAMYLTSQEAVLTLNDSPQTKLPALPFGVTSTDRHQPSTTESKRTTLRMKFVGGSARAVSTGIDELPGKCNYFIGNDPKKWHVSVPRYARVKYEQVYRGVDLIYYGNPRQLEYDLIVAPGADPKAIRLEFDSSARVRIDHNGDLVVEASGKEIRQLKPRAYQESDGRTKQIAANYVLKRKNQIGFVLDGYDPRKVLVVDPVLSYSTYLGGSSEEAGSGITTDAVGNAYVTGFTTSSDFPVNNALQSTLPGFTSAFVTKLDPTGTALVYSTYLGGNDSDVGLGIAVDSTGSACITGYTTSTNFPVVNAVQPTPGGSFTSDAFVTRINPSGDALVYSTYLGGSKMDVGQGIAVDSAGAAYVTGYTFSPNFPTASAMQPALVGRTDAFATKFSPSGALAYSTYLGGRGGDNGLAIAVDASGQAYVAGGTTSPDFPLHNAMQTDFRGRTIFKSTDGGGHWMPINNGLPPYLGVNAIAVDPITSMNVYAGTTTGGIFKSLDGGNNWASAILDWEQHW